MQLLVACHHNVHGRPGQQQHWYYQVVVGLDESLERMPISGMRWWYSPLQLVAVHKHRVSPRSLHQSPAAYCVAAVSKLMVG